MRRTLIGGGLDVPREYRLLSAEPVDLQIVRDAAGRVDPALQPRLLFGGWAVQLVDQRNIAVLTVEASRLLDDIGQAEELIASRSGAGRATGRGPLWWTEASAPWGEYGEPGARIARVIAESVQARLLAEEGQ